MQEYLNDCLCRKKLQISKAFMQAQAELDSIDATAKNAHYKNEYAQLKDLYNASKKALRRHGIFIKHNAKFHPVTNQQISCTYLWHADSGETFDDERYLVPEKPGSQGHGAADTYMKRYALRSLLACDVGEDDDDGESERAYLKKLDDFMNLIKKHSKDPKQLYIDMLKHFHIDHHYKIGDHRLFDAVCWVMENI